MHPVPVSAVGLYRGDGSWMETQQNANSQANYLLECLLLFLSLPPSPSLCLPLSLSHTHTHTHIHTHTFKHSSRLPVRLSHVGNEQEAAFLIFASIELPAFILIYLCSYAMSLFWHVRALTYGCGMQDLVP